MPADLTAILLPAPPRGKNPNDILTLVAQNAPSVVWVRLAPLAKHGLTQLEVLEGQNGLPAVAPALVEALSKNDGKAMFLHLNHQAKQALLHAFEDGVEVATFTGEPGEAFDTEVTRLAGAKVDDLVAADDGTRLGFGQAASRTAALVRGRLLLVPAGTPTGLGSFAFHDRGHDLPANAEHEAADEDDDDGADTDEAQDTMRVFLFAFDHDLIAKAWNELPGKQLAQVVGSAPPEVLGPLYGLRDEAVAALSGLETPPGQLSEKQQAHISAFELLALAHAGVFTGGDAGSYLDHRVLPLLAIGDSTPIIDDDEEAKELEDMGSVLEAMVEVLPCPKPPGGYGPILEALGNGELLALAPWAQPGQEYDGAIFRVQPERLLQLARSLDGNKLSVRLDRFCRALYEARHGKPQDDNLYTAWRGTLEERSSQDLDRFLTDWAELRIVLEMAAMNKLAVGLVVYDA